MPKRDLIVIAPHPDDELIGCFTLFDSKQVNAVIYLEVEDQKRFEEAEHFCDVMCVESMYVPFLKDLSEYLYSSSQKFIVPSVYDNHMLHKAVGAMFMHERAEYGVYTVDMTSNYARELTKNDANNKRSLLDDCYPSQSSLWESDWKYWLFEGVVITNRGFMNQKLLGSR